MDDLVTFAVDSQVHVTADVATIVLTVDVPDGAHIEPHQPADPFLIPTVVTVGGLDDVTVDYPAPVEKDLGWHDTVLSILEGRLEFTVKGQIPPHTSVVSGGISYQPCLGGACLPPRTALWSVHLPSPVNAGR
jgi:uncharacterized protein